VVVGGETPTAVLDTAEAYDIESETWRTYPPMSKPRHGPGAATERSVFYVLHGAKATGHNNSSVVVEALEPPPR
jgi:hypothetical protein